MRTLPILLMSVTASANAANYTAARETVDGVETVRLRDAAAQTVVTIVPSIGNVAWEMAVNGKNVFFTPYATLAEFTAKPTLLGNPFLAPWANRLDGDGFHANGKRYSLDPSIANFRRDGHKQPIHGLLAYSPLWKADTVQADEGSAWVTSTLEFWRHPDLMAQFPFAHTLHMTYRLAKGVLEVETVVRNHAAEPMPLSIGYHPYFRLYDAPRDQWQVWLPAREHVELSPTLVPTGERKPNPYASPLSLAGAQLDDVFAGLAQPAHFKVKGAKQEIVVEYGPKYPVAVVYAPKGRDFICFEPMTGVTNAFNLHHAGKYPELQSVPAGGEWKESFWIRPAGF